MFTPDTQQVLAGMSENARVTLQVVDFKIEVPYLMADDFKALLAAGQTSDGHGTNASCEHWIFNTRWSPAAMKILSDSPLTYKHIPEEKQWWRRSPL